MGLLARIIEKTTTGKKPAQGPRNLTETRYRGVQIVPGGNDCCMAARSIADERYLSAEAPLLPLSVCDAEVCNCRYERFDDRRAEFRRTADIGYDLVGRARGQDKRSSKSRGRRSTDGI